MNLILGGGLAGISLSYHLGHDRCIVLEKNPTAFGHIKSTLENGFTWDQGPHVSFTKHDYVKQLFADSVSGEFDEYPVRTRNYFQGHWIDHPAQSNLYQIPSPLREQCLESFLESRTPVSEIPADYQKWLECAFGSVFAQTFPGVYSQKYWTANAKELTVDWVGSRMYLPDIEDFKSGALGPLNKQTHYITHVRYPKRGGYTSFARKMSDGMRLKCGEEVTSIDLQTKRVTTASGAAYDYTRVFSTLPLPVFIDACAQADEAVREAACSLVCTSVLLVQVTVPHPTQIDGNWFYVYDKDKWSTRIHCTETLTPGNAPSGHTGIQVEVYFSKYRPLSADIQTIEKAVVAELIEMGFINPSLLVNGLVDIRSSARPIKWANVLFDHQRRPALDVIFKWLEKWGLEREMGDLEATTDWGTDNTVPCGTIVLAGRFSQWKYFWTDDCVLRGKQTSIMGTK